MTVKTKKLPKSEIERIIIHFLRHGKDWPYLPRQWQRVPDFPYRVHLVRPNDMGESHLYMVDHKNVARPFALGPAAGLIHKYLHSLPHTFKDFYISVQFAKEIAAGLVTMEPHSRDRPLPVGFKSDNDLVLLRHNFDPVPYSEDEFKEKAPVFSEMLHRCDDPESLKARIGSIFFKDADRKQVVWLYGYGDCGKSTMDNLIRKMVGNVVNVGQDNFKRMEFTASILDARVALVQESSNYILMSQKFKQLTGDEDHLIRPLFRNPFMGKLDTIFFFSTNSAPEIPHDDAIIKRLITIKMGTLSPGKMLPTVEIDAILENEMPVIIGHCMSFYRNFVGVGKRIDSKNYSLEGAIEDFNLTALSWMEENLVEDKTTDISPLALERAMRKVGLNQELKKDIRDLLQTKWGIRRYRDADGKRWYKGLKFRPNVPGVTKEDNKTHLTAVKGGQCHVMPS